MFTFTYHSLLTNNCRLGVLLSGPASFRPARASLSRGFLRRRRQWLTLTFRARNRGRFFAGSAHAPVSRAGGLDEAFVGQLREGRPDSFPIDSELFA